MKRKLFLNKVYVSKSKTHGFGVFADKKIRKGELIEECYFILSKGGDRVLEDFYFDARESKNKRYAMFTGYGSIYNHSQDPNADYFLNITKRVARIKAERDIKKGEEILISYGDHWFKDRGYEPNEANDEKKIVTRKKKKNVTRKKKKRFSR